MPFTSTFFHTTGSYWLVVLVVSSVLAAKYMYHALLGQQRTPRWITYLRSGAAILIVGMLTVDGLNFLFGRIDPSLRPVATAALIIVAVTIAYWHLRFATLRLTARELMRKPVLWALLATSVGAAGWSLQRFKQTVSLAENVFALEAFMEGELHEDPELVAVTDRGRVLPLFRFSTLKTPARALAISESLKTETGSTAIFRAPPDPNANCHGWVFTGGRFLVKGDNVQQILDDNGYGRVPEPEAGDLVVYRDQDAYISHTGVVRGILNDETIIVESKWGVEGTYLHAPEAQPFSQVFGFYRSSRRGHLVLVRERDPNQPPDQEPSRPDSTLKLLQGQRQSRGTPDGLPDNSPG